MGLRVGIIGMGEIGNANWTYLHKRHECFTYDKNRHGDLPEKYHKLTIPECDIYLICVDSDNIEKAIRELRELHKNPLISIESTARVGTCEQLEPIIYCPQRYWKNDPYSRGVRRDRLIAATDMKEAIDIYSKQFDMTVYPVSFRDAEIAKIAENAYVGVMIAFAQELYQYCEEKSVDYEVVRAAIQTADNNHWMAEIRDGVKGHCIPMAMDWAREWSVIVNTADIANRAFMESLENE